ncbi:MAG TPA: transposase [Chloroflexota bacterium]|nr:transposase [Chloroflexota bacterium]
MQNTELVPQPLEGGPLAQLMAQRCAAYLHPLLTSLDAQLDCRLVRTLAHSVLALVRHRNRALALLLSELGAYLAGPEHAPAGTKRLANLIHSPRWQAAAIGRYLLRQGQARVLEEAARVPEGRALCILDGSVVEKPESVEADGLAPVRSSKARRLARPRPKQGPGYYRGKPGPAPVVPGWHWVAALVTGWALPSAKRPLTLGAWHWFAHPLSPDYPRATATAGLHQREAEAQRHVLEQVTAAWGADRLLHVWDRGLSGAGWLGETLDHGWHFVVRWKKGNHLRPADAPSVGAPTALPTHRERDGVAAWRLTAGLRPWGERRLPHPRRRGQTLGIRYAARPVRLVHRDDPLWLVVVRLDKAARRRGGSEPWRLLTTEPVTPEAECWRIVEAYWARWQIEQQLRFGKSELGIESVRVRDWEARAKLLALVALTYACLVHLLGDGTDPLLPAVLRWAHRTGTQARERWRPLYRLRAALWNKHTPSLQGVP